MNEQDSGVGIGSDLILQGLCSADSSALNQRLCLNFIVGGS